MGTLGLRAQILAALTALLVLAFVPLVFAVLRLTQVSLLAEREEGAKRVGAVLFGALEQSGDPEAMRKVARSAVTTRAALGVEALDASGRALFREGLELAGSCKASPPSYRSLGGQEVSELASVRGGLCVRALFPIPSGASESGAAMRLVVLYMSIFGLALLVFAYWVLTRLMVRPIESLALAADRVANGALSLDVPRGGAKEISDLGLSVHRMADKLLLEDKKLRAKVAELTRANLHLTEARTQLVRSDRLASVGRLAAGVAHEIGNPITAILGMEELILSGQLSSEEERDFVRRMQKETERIGTVVRDLLDFSRPEDPDPEARTLVKQAFSDALSLVRVQKDFRDVTFEETVENADLRVKIASGRLSQVLLNLLLNAASAPRSDERGARRVVLSAAMAPPWVEIVVEDNGPGIAEDVRERLFEPFVTTKDVGKGTGLGLAVCRGIVEGAGGEIGLDGAFRDGARFVVRLLPG